MKFKFAALILALTIASWAQTINSAQPAPSDKVADTKCTCCDKMGAKASEHKHTCMHPKSSANDGKDVASCCSGKDHAACCKGKDGKACAKMQTASAACCEGTCCGRWKGRLRRQGRENRRTQLLWRKTVHARSCRTRYRRQLAGERQGPGLHMSGAFCYEPCFIREEILQL